MPFPRTWVEELLAEWLLYQGYLVSTGLAVPIPKQHRQNGGKGGGRYEADVVGIRRAGDGYEIRHIESGALMSKESVERLRKKFSRYMCQEVRSRCALPSASSGCGTKYIKQYVVTYPHQKRAEQERWASEVGKVDPEVEVIALDELLRREILPTLRRSAARKPTIPEGHWLLCLLDYAQDWEVMKEDYDSQKGSEGDVYEKDPLVK